MVSRVQWERLTVKKQYRPLLRPFYHEDVQGYDTETLQGKAVLIADGKGDYDHPESFDDCIKFLTRKKYRGVIGWFKNINYDVEAILKWLDEKTVREFAKTGELSFIPENMFNPVSLKYIPGKMLKIVRSKHSFIFYDIGNFLKGSLDDLGEKYLGKRKYPAPLDWNSDLKLSDFHKQKTIKYCIRDAWITEKLGKLFMDTCNNFDIYSKNYCSPASLATHYFMSNVDIPTLSDMQRGSKLRTKLAYEAYKGGFITNFRKGYYDDVYLYDINSAYPYEMTKLPDLSKGKFVFRFKRIPKDAAMGWMRCIVHTPDDKKYPYAPCYHSPLPVYVKRFNKNFYFGGTIHTTITLLEYEALKNDFDITVKDGIYWMPDQMVFLYKDIIEKLYKLKSEYKKGDQNIYQLIKIILNGFYGKTIQKIPIAESKEFNTGNLFNPYHASYITAGCRVQCYKLIRGTHPMSAIAVMTDGIAFDRELDIPESKALGDWSLDMAGEGVFIGSGLYTIKNAKKTKTATRGFKLTDRIDFFRLLAENYDKTEIELPQTVRLSYKEALRIKKFIDWNLIKDGIKKFKINCDNKRIWVEDFHTCADVLNKQIDSCPIMVNMKGGDQ